MISQCDNHIEHDISVYFIPAVRIFLDRQMSDIKARDILGQYF